MERKSPTAVTELLTALGEKLPRLNFYRLCQLLEQVTACQQGDPKNDDSVRFRSWPTMGFPAGEIKCAELPASEFAHFLPPSIRVTFMGLYGVESPVPPVYNDAVARRLEGHEALSDFLDIFNHRLIMQFYHIWRKCSYPATFQSGGTDKTSSYLLCLTGLGIPGCEENISTPVTRFLALASLMRLPVRPAEGLVALVRLLAPQTRASIIPHDPCRIPLVRRLKLSYHHPVSLANRPVIGEYVTEVNSQILLRLATDDADEVKGWLPGKELHRDLLSLLHVYLGSRLQVRLQLVVRRDLLPQARLYCQPQQYLVQAGRTAVMKMQGCSKARHQVITVSLGRYQRLRENFHRRKTDNYGDYRW